MRADNVWSAPGSQQGSGRQRVINGLKEIMKATLFPLPILSFLFGSAGREYGVGFGQKMSLMYKVWRNALLPGSASSFLEQLVVVHGVLAIPRDVRGDVVEFGCYKGAATASLSLACGLTRRRLLVFDSFAGLPDGALSTHITGDAMVHYKAGDYCGTLEEVRRTVTQWGDVGVCEFVKGLFEATLPQRAPDEQYALIFEDADLPSSVRTVFQWAWPKLHAGCTFFSHEAREQEVVEMFFDHTWWKTALGCRAPGFVGSGLGLPLGPRGSCLGYIVKSAEKTLP